MDFLHVGIFVIKKNIFFYLALAVGTVQKGTSFPKNCNISKLQHQKEKNNFAAYIFLYDFSPRIIFANNRHSYQSEVYYALKTPIGYTIFRHILST